MVEQPKDPFYDAVLELAKVHLEMAWEAFRTDDRIAWQEFHGHVPKGQHRMFVDALRETMEHHQQLERLLS